MDPGQPHRRPGRVSILRGLPGRHPQRLWLGLVPVVQRQNAESAAMNAPNTVGNPQHRTALAALCDEWIDRRGGYLGRVRDAVLAARPAEEPQR